MVKNEMWEFWHSKLAAWYYDLWAVLHLGDLNLSHAEALLPIFTIIYILPIIWTSPSQPHLTNVCCNNSAKKSYNSLPFLLYRWINGVVWNPLFKESKIQSRRGINHLSFDPEFATLLSGGIKKIIITKQGRESRRAECYRAGHKA